MSVRAPTHDELAAKWAITEVIHRYCRGLDRMDKALALSCWHPDGTDDHAPLYAGSATGFIDWLWPVHAAMNVTRHVVSNTLIDLHADGTTAGAETCWSLLLQTPQGVQTFDIVAGGRYLDRFECIDGVWAIRHRQSVVDWNRVDPVRVTLADFAATPLIDVHNPEVPATVPRRDAADFSYSVLGHIERH